MATTGNDANRFERPAGTVVEHDHVANRESRDLSAQSVDIGEVGDYSKFGDDRGLRVWGAYWVGGLPKTLDSPGARIDTTRGLGDEFEKSKTGLRGSLLPDV